MSPRILYNDSDIELLARIMKAEALGEGEEGMLMVGNVIVNRVVANCDVFKNTRTISEVVYQKMPLPVSTNPCSINLLMLKKKNSLYVILMVIALNQQQMHSGLKILAAMSPVPNNFMVN
ncbi:cell wall hydrolase [Allocoprobacillus halotolerans]|uniref:cell wall hydrolase n=1 Tax=Allocoprobacillus halotolerans TaxID=2944914 RepID=UPI00338E5C31